MSVGFRMAWEHGSKPAGAYLDDVRGVERRIQAIERHNAWAAQRTGAAPLGVPDSWEEHVKLMFDLQALAFATETTRVSAFKMSRDTSNRIFPESGVKTPFHTLSHHSQKPALIAEFATLNRYHVSLLPYFLQKLKDTPDGDGNLLDHSLILYGSRWAIQTLTIIAACRFCWRVTRAGNCGATCIVYVQQVLRMPTAF